MGTPGQLLNLYFPPQETWIQEAVERKAQIEGISTTEMYIRLIEKAGTALKLRYPEALAKETS